MFPVGRPFFRMCPSLVTRKMAAVTKELATLVSLGIIRPLSRKLASPLHCVRNPTVAVSLAMISAGKTQSPTMTAPIQSAIFRISTPNLEEKNLFQVDLVKYYHPIRDLQDFNAELGGKKSFSSRSGKILPSNSCGESRCFENSHNHPIWFFSSTSTWSKKCTRVFQCLMDSVPRYLSITCFHLDFILVGSENEEHRLVLIDLFDMRETNSLIFAGPIVFSG